MLDTKRIIILNVLTVLLLVACTKEDSTTTNDNSEQYSDTPSITFISVTPSPVKELDSLTFKISYKDGNGDLGENTYNAKNVFVTDLRTHTTDSLRVQRLVEGETSAHIKGNMNIVLYDIAIQGSNDKDTVSYTIQVRDRAGNKSNVVTTSPIIINRN